MITSEDWRARMSADMRLRDYFFVPSSGDAPLHENTLQKTFTAAYAGLGLTSHAAGCGAWLFAFARSAR